MPKKKRTTTKKKKPTGKRVGAVKNNSVVMQAVGALAGGIGGPMLISMVGKMVPSIDPKIVKYGGAALQGVGGYMIGGKSKDPLMQGLGIGLMVAGGTTLVSTIAPGLIGAVPVLMPQRGLIGGFREVPRLGAVTTNGGFPKPAAVGRLTNMTRIYGGL